MGLDYSYTVIADTEKVEEVIQDLIGAVDPESRAELQAALPFRINAILTNSFGTVRYGIDGIELEDYGHQENDYCFSLAMPVIESDSGASDYIGCVWTSFFIGDYWSMIRLRAATSSISREFEKEGFKKNVLSLFPNATYILFNNEDVEEFVKPGNLSNFCIHEPDDERDVEELNWEIDINWFGKHVSEIVAGKLKET